MSGNSQLTLVFFGFFSPAPPLLLRFLAVLLLCKVAGWQSEIYYQAWDEAYANSLRRRRLGLAAAYTLYELQQAKGEHDYSRKFENK